MNKYKALIFFVILTGHAAVLASVINLPHDPNRIVTQTRRIEVALIQAEPVAVKQPEPTPESVKKPEVKPVEKFKPVAVVPTVVAAAQPVVVPIAAPTPAPAPEAPVIKEAPPLFDAAYLRNPIPSYPSVSRRTGEEGKVLLRVLVDGRGMPVQIELQKSSGFNRLDQAALSTVNQWKFVPAKRGDQVIEGWVIVPITFKLES